MYYRSCALYKAVVTGESLSSCTLSFLCEKLEDLVLNEAHV